MLETLIKILINNKYLLNVFFIIIFILFYDSSICKNLFIK